MDRKQTRKLTKRLVNYHNLYVDGTVELEYFKHININNDSSIKLNIKIGNELDFIRNCADEIPTMVILDIDATTKKNDPKKRYLNLKKIIEGPKKKNVFFNNFSFETFLLLHVMSFSKPIYKKEEYDILMKNYFGIKDSWSVKKNEYNRRKVFSKINEETRKIAISKMKHMSKKPFRNPSSNMDKFFEEIGKKKSPVSLNNC